MCVVTLTTGTHLYSMTASTSRRGARPPLRRPVIRSLVLLTVVALLCTTALAPLVPTVAASSSTDRATGVAVSATDVPAQQLDPPPNSNETDTDNQTSDRLTRHRDPRQVSEQGNLTALERHFQSLLASRLQQSTVEIDRNQLDRARSLLGEEYDVVLRRYVTVADESPGRDDDASHFESAKTEQELFVEQVEAYRETRAEYEQAKQVGNESRARILARELNVLANETAGSHDRLSTEYEALESDSGIDFSESRATVTSIQQNISTEQAIIRETEFVRTNFETSSVSGGNSFVDPIRISGVLVDANGNPFANDVVRIVVNGTEIMTETDASGAFSVAYRPVTDGVGQQTLTVEYRPAVDDLYLGTNATVSATITQVVPTVSVTQTSTAARFGDPVSVTGSVDVDGRAVDGVPLSVSVDETVIGSVETDETGTYTFEGTLPADVTAGNQTISVGFPFEERALAPVWATAPLRVAETETELSVDGRQTTFESVLVSGTMTTAEGRPVPAVPVEVSIAGTPAGILRTNDAGEFEENLWLPPNATGATTVDVVATFDGTETNLASVRATATVPVVGTDGIADGDEAAETGSDTTIGGIGRGRLDGLYRAFVISASTVEVYGFNLGDLVTSPWAPVVFVLVLVVALAFLFGWIEARRTPALPPVSGVTLDETGRDAAAKIIDSDALPRLLVDLARDRLRAGDVAAAVEYGYLASRWVLARRLSVENRGTHRQFVAVYLDAVSETGTGDGHFTNLTEWYERAVFASETLSEEDASTALGHVDRLVDGGDESGAESGPEASTLPSGTGGLTNQ